MLISVCFLALISLANGDSTLKLVNLLYRHGDRSPVVIFPKDPNQADKWPQGLGWLTITGMHQHYLLGDFLRRRYVETGFLSREYKHTEIQIESSDENRCLMSAYCNLAGLFPPDIDQRFNESIHWQPIPVHTRPAKEDNTLNMGENCPRYNKALDEVFHSPEVQKEEQKNKAFYAWLGEKTGVDHENINNIWQIADTLFCEKSHNFTLAGWVNNTVYSKLRSLLDYQFELLYYTKELQRLKGGPLLGEMIDNMRNKTRKYNPIAAKMFMYSAHDTTVASLLSALQVFNDISPPYAAMVILELHQNTTGNYFVRLYYKNSTTNLDFMNSLTIPGCTQSCSLETFIQLTKLVIPTDWLKECGLTNQNSTGVKFFTAWIIVVVLAVLLVVLLGVSVVMYISYKRNRPGFKMERLSNKA